MKRKREANYALLHYKGWSQVGQALCAAAQW